MGIHNFYTLTFKNKKFLKNGIFIFPIFFILLLIFNKIIFGIGNESYLNFLAEDGPVESATAIFYFLTCLMSIIIAINFIKIKNKICAFLFFVLSASIFFVVIEEISWAQRILGFDTPEFFSDNLQNEITIHNLPVMQNLVFVGYFIVSLFGSFFWILLPKIKNTKVKDWLQFIIPQRSLISYFFQMFLFIGMLGIRAYIPTSPEGLWFSIFHWKDLEAVELLLSVGIFLFVLTKIIMLYNLKRIQWKYEVRTSTEQ